MRITLVAMLIIFSSMNAAYSACEGETCIDVKANQESNEVVITVKKGKAGIQVSTTPKPKLSSTIKRTWIPWLPKPPAASKPVAYERGDGALAQRAQDRAEGDDSSYAMSKLLRQVFNSAWAPNSFAQMRSELHPKICSELFSGTI